MEKGIVVAAAGGIFTKTAFPGTPYLTWYKKFGWLEAEGKINLLNVMDRKESFICKKCKMVSFSYR